MGAHECASDPSHRPGLRRHDRGGISVGRAQTGPPLPIETPAPAAGEAAVQIAEPVPPIETPPAEMLPPQLAQILQAEQLDQLLAPIALYPDALLAQILMASTYPLEIVKANRW